LAVVPYTAASGLTIKPKPLADTEYVPEVEYVDGSLPDCIAEPFVML
jgi:hypothetical protein